MALSNCTSGKTVCNDKPHGCFPSGFAEKLVLVLISIVQSIVHIVHRKDYSLVSTIYMHWYGPLTRKQVYSMWQIITSHKRHMPLQIPDSKVHGANMGPVWGWQDPGAPNIGPMNFAIWDCIACVEMIYVISHCLSNETLDVWATITTWMKRLKASATTAKWKHFPAKFWQFYRLIFNPCWKCWLAS